MNIYLISEYVNRLRKSDIIYYAEKQGISLSEISVDKNYDTAKVISVNGCPYDDNFKQKNMTVEEEIAKGSEKVGNDIDREIEIPIEKE